MVSHKFSLIWVLLGLAISVSGCSKSGMGSKDKGQRNTTLQKGATKNSGSSASARSQAQIPATQQASAATQEKSASADITAKNDTDKKQALDDVNDVTISVSPVSAPVYIRHNSAPAPRKTYTQEKMSVRSEPVQMQNKEASVQVQNKQIQNKIEKKSENKAITSSDRASVLTTRVVVTAETDSSSNKKIITAKDVFSGKVKSNQADQLLFVTKKKAMSEKVAKKSANKKPAKQAVADAKKPADKAKKKSKKVATSKAKSKANPNRKLKAQLFYQNQIDSTAKAAFANVLAAMDLRFAIEAKPVDDVKYANTISLITGSVARSVYTIVEKSSACDLNVVGACVVFEKDSVTGETQERAYYMASMPKDETGGFSIIRREVSDARVTRDIKTILNGQPDGSYIFAQVKNAAEVNKLLKIAVQVETKVTGDGQKKRVVKKSEPFIRGSFDQPDGTNEDSPEFWKSIDDDRTEYNAAPISTNGAIKTYAPTEQDERDREQAYQEYLKGRELRKNRKNSPWTDEEMAWIQSGGSNSNNSADDTEEDIVTYAKFNYCRITADLVMQQKFVLVDFLRSRTDGAGNKAYVPTKMGKGMLTCTLYDKTVQRVKIEIKDFQNIRLGIAMSSVTQHLYAAGIGMANGVLDILNIKNFSYIMQGDAQAAVGGVSVTPIILSTPENSSNSKPILAGQISGVLQPMLLNLNLTLTGHYEINVDPDGT